MSNPKQNRINTPFKTKKILFVTTISRTVREFLLPYAQALQDNGGIVDAMCNGSDVELKKHFHKIWPVNFSRNPILAVALLPYTLMRTRKIIIEGNYDIVHVHTPIASFVTRLSIALMRKKKRPIVIYTAHGFHFHPLGSRVTNWIYLRLEKFAARYTDYLITINEWDYSAAVKEHFLPEERIFYIKGIGIDTKFYDPYGVAEAEISGLRKETDCTDSTKFLCVIAEFIPRKRHIDVLNAIGNMKNIKVIFVGDGKLRKNIGRKAKAWGLTDKVLFLGYRHDIPRILKASAAMLLPSVREGLPRVVMEAMSMGTPIIASDIRGVRELLSDGYGILIEPKNPEAIARAIRWVIENEEEAKKMAAKAREKVRKEYDIRVVLPQHLEVYKQAINNRKSHT